MAWFSVHESIYGSKLRELYHRLDCSEFEAVGILIALWSWGLSNAEKDGYLPYAGMEELNRYFYSRSAGCFLEPPMLVSALISTGWLDETERGLCIHDWDLWQEQWYHAKEKREKDAERKRESRKKSAVKQAAIYEKAAPPAAASPEIQPEKPPEDQTEPKPGNQPEKPKEPKYGKEFELFWKEYPRKVGKGEAYKKYAARRKDGFTPEELLEAAKNYAERCRKQKTEQDYIKHAKTFLSENTPFLDYLPKKEDEAEQREPTGNPFAKYMEEE